MISLIKMALRDLGRNRRRSFFSALALGIGLALLMLIATVINGEFYHALDAAIKLQSGDLQVRAGSYDESKTSLAWKDLIADPQAMASQIAGLAPVQVATPRLYASGIVASGNQSLGVRIVGIDPASAANAPYRDGLVNGQFLAADDQKGIYIGWSLADKLGLKTGDTLMLMSNTSNGDVDQQPFEIRGIFNIHEPIIDQGTVFLPLAKAQALTKTENHASLIFVLLKDRSQTAAVVNALKTSQYQVKTWEQLNDLLVTTEQMVGAYYYLIYLIVLGITATVIVNTLIMAVFERTREIGILAAIGMKASRIMAMFFAESTLLAVGGIVIGLALGAVLVYWDVNYGVYIGNMGVSGMLLGDRLLGRFVPGDVVTVAVLALVVALVSALYPALLAARMEPVEALRGGKQA